MARGPSRTPLIVRFERKINKTETCWLWIGGIAGGTGYGIFHFEGRQQGSHRVAYQLYVGPIAPGMWLDHICRVRACVRPDHLRQVTPRQNCIENSLSIAARNASATACPAGHPYDEVNTYWRPDRVGKFCKTCSKERHRIGAKRAPFVVSPT